MAESLLGFLESLPAGPLYSAIAALAAVENIVPPVPADLAVALGAFLAGRGTLNAWAVFGVTWVANVSSASLVYWVARRYGPGFFAGRVGRKLLSEAMLAKIGREYERHGSAGIFISRLLPVWRWVVPPFAGLSGLSPARSLVPVALASAVYYGLLTFLVATLGTNFEEVRAALGQVGLVLSLAALLLLLLVVRWMLRRTD